MTCVNIMAGFETTGIYPVNRDVILAALPGEQRSSEGMIVPRSVFTPFKRVPEDGLYTSADITPQSSVSIAKRPNLLTDIVSLKTPKQKTKRIKPPSDMVLTSSEFRNKNGITKGTSKTPPPLKSE